MNKKKQLFYHKLSGNALCLSNFNEMVELELIKVSSFPFVTIDGQPTVPLELTVNFTIVLDHSSTGIFRFYPDTIYEVYYDTLDIKTWNLLGVYKDEWSNLRKICH